MSLLGPDKGQITFQDVAACFSEEEWKLLHEWQKELYKSVMNDIHQALVSLGPLIATSVFSLRAKEKEHLSSVDIQYDERRPSDHNSPSYQAGNPDTSDWINERDDTNIWDQREPDLRADINESSSDCYPAIRPDILHQIQQEELQCRDWPGSEGTENNGHPKGFQLRNADICWSKEEESNAFLISHSGAQAEHLSKPQRGSEVISFIIKEEEEANCLDHQDVVNQERISSPTGARFVSRNKSNEEYVRCNEKKQCKATSEKAKALFPQITENGKKSRIHLQSKRSPELTGERNIQLESGLNNPSNSNLHQEALRTQISDMYKEHETELHNAALLPCQPEMQQSWTPYTYVHRKQTYFQKGDSLKHHRTRSKHSLYQGVDGLNSYSGASYLTRHQKTSTRHRPYQCNVCEQSFSWKNNLIRHQTKHTGEKPYQCDECEKSFTQKGTLTIHQRIHSGERPYQCTQCETSFREKKQLIRHFRKAHKQ
ncbi:zinc finger protein 182-like isoform X2 [Ambystoma mexicanum]|uniref:zinc finger protein 182-like isoform X2 n=1 Tax=Ambystoma mexicanum TaxID=8296 RepID=UPI0037E84CF4